MPQQNNARKITGIPVSDGIGIGTAWVLEDKKISVRPEKIKKNETEAHLSRFSMAVEQLAAEYEELKKISEENFSGIIEAQIQTLHDPELHKSIVKKIAEEHFDVMFSIFSTFNEYIQLMELMDSDWLHERTVDIVSIRDQLIEAAREKRSEVLVPDGAVVFATEISPTVMVELSRGRIEGIVMQKGGLTSHAVILSQSLGIPCVVGAKWKHLNVVKGMEVILDGLHGEVILLPGEGERHEYQTRRERQKKKTELDLRLGRELHKTSCGTDFFLRANVEFLEELPRIAKYGAKGVGLLRTETILFQKTGFGVAEQVEYYSSVAESAGDEPVTIRLFDAGGDKFIDDVEEEANPFLGWRGIRMLLDERELLVNQVEAICRVSSLYPGRVQILVPMITGLKEVDEVKQVIERTKTDLREQGIAADPALKFGVMVEVPSVALMADSIASHVDFFSVGTNDLTQYTLAVDRGNEKISHLFEPFHPSIWKLIAMTRDAAVKYKIDISVCGEMASKPAAAACLLGMGITDLSMTTGAVPAVKALLCNRPLAEMKKLSERVLNADTPDQVHTLFEQFSL